MPIRPATVWGKLYRKGFIVDNHISFASGMVLNEDVLFNACLLLKTPKIEYLPLSLYYYRINNSNSGSTPEKDIERKLLVAAEAMSAFADECDSSEIHERVSLRIDSYVQRYFRKYIMSNYVEGYFNKRREFFRFTNISIFKKARKTVNMKNIDFTGKLFYICTEKGCFFPLYMREKLRNAKARIKHPLVK